MTAPHGEPLHPAMPNGLRLGAPFGISLTLHWSFLLLGGWLGLGVLDRTGSWAALGGLLVIVGVVFGSVALHEYGHALVARRFGIGTREITLLPIGGIAQLERSPSDPRQELWISAAGPAVNFALAAAALAVMQLGGEASAATVGDVGGTPMLALALQVNLLMGAFNLLPALPMDGGRMLRALLALRLPVLRATQLASGVAQVLAVGMMLYGVSVGRLMLAVIGGFVWITARAERTRVETEVRMRRRAEAMTRAGVGRPGAGPGDAPGEWSPAGDDGPPAGTRTVGSSRTRHR